MSSFASIHASAQKTVAALKAIRAAPVLLGNFCIISLNVPGKKGLLVIPGVTLLSKDASGKTAKNQTKNILTKQHGGQKTSGLGVGIVQCSSKGALTFHLLSSKGLAEDALQRALRSLSTIHSDLRFLKGVEVRSGQSREDLLTHLSDSNPLSESEIADILEKAGMVDGAQREHCLELLQQTPPYAEQLDAIEAMNIGLEAFGDELEQQRQMLEEYETASPVRREAIIATLSIQASIGENLPRAGRVPPTVATMLQHIETTFAADEEPDLFDAFAALSF